MVTIDGVTAIHYALALQCVNGKHVPGLTVAYDESGVHQMPNDSPHPHAEVELGLDISNCDPNVSSIQSIRVPATYSIDVSSTTKRPVPQSSTWSPSATLSLVSANPHSYLKPAHPPPSTARLTAYLPGFFSSSRSICDLAASVISNKLMLVIMLTCCPCF